MIPMSPGEVADRFSILWLKWMHDHSLFNELQKFNAEVNALLDKAPLTIELFHEVHKVNKAIWKLEADIRSGTIPDSELEEIGRRAIKIRDWNKIRVQAKGQIDLFFGYTPERKINHRSQ